MKIIPFFLISLGIFALINFVLIPKTKQYLGIDKSMASIKHAATLSMMGFIRTLFLVSSLTSLGVIIIFLILQMFTGNTVEEVTAAISRINRWQEILSGLGQFWGWMITLVLTISLAFYAHRSGKTTREKVFQKLYEQKFEELKEKIATGELEYIEPTAEMHKVAERLSENLSMIRAIEQENKINDPQVSDFYQELLKQVPILEQYYFAMDAQRRIEKQIDFEDIELPAPKSVWEKFQVFLMSQGLVYSLTKTSRVLYLASLVLLIPALLGIYSLGSVPAFDDRLVELKDLRIEISQKEFEKEKQRLGEPQAELSKEDEEVIKEVAKEYEKTAIPFRMATPIRATVFVTRSNLVRQTILHTAAQRANTTRNNYSASAEWETPHSGTQIEDLTPLEKKVVESPERAAYSRDPVTPQGKQMEAELKDVARRSPTFKERLKNGLLKFQKPASQMDLFYALSNNIASSLAAETPGDFGDILKGVRLENTQATARSYAEAHSKEFLRSIMNDGDLDKAFKTASSSERAPGFVTDLERVQYQTAMRTVTENIPFTDINQKFADKPPSIQTKPEKFVKMETAVASIEKYNDFISPYQGLRNNLSNADAVMDFTDLFPGQLGAETKTDHGQIINKWRPDDPIPPVSSNPVPPSGGGGGGGFSSGSTKTSKPVSTASRGSFSRARSFSFLRGFSRIGGVLIGQEPSDVSKNNPSKLNFTDLKWEMKENKLNLILINGDGNQIRSRSFRPSVVYRALSYASDGRATTATMINATPLLDLKILLHPTLIDTPMGYRMIELDRFVDIYSTKNSELKKSREEATLRLISQKFLYKFAWAERLSVLFADQSDRESMMIAERINKILIDDELRKYAAIALRDTQSINDPSKSPLSVKKEFFDKDLVKILASMPSGSSLEKLGEAVRQEARKQWDNIKYSGEAEKEKLMKKWLSSNPEFDVWSGVREKNFTTNTVNFFVSDGTEIPMPFDFMLQVAFTTPPSLVDESTAENYNDVQPWEFPLLRDQIQSTVLEEIKKDARSKEILDDASEFTMLQRLFRMALNGQLGENFPVERLIELSNMMAENTKENYYRTLRWNANIPPTMMKKISEKDGKIGEDIFQLYEALGISKDHEQIARERNMPLPPLE